MSEITIRILPKLAERILADKTTGGQSVASLSSQAIRIVQTHGRRITYAPLLMLPLGIRGAMSARGGHRGAVIEIDGPEAIIPGRGIIIDNCCDQVTTKNR